MGRLLKFWASHRDRIGFSSDWDVRAEIVFSRPLSRLAKRGACISFLDFPARIPVICGATVLEGPAAPLTASLRPALHDSEADSVEKIHLRVDFAEFIRKWAR
jgi:hypothetical protein